MVIAPSFLLGAFYLFFLAVVRTSNAVLIGHRDRRHPYFFLSPWRTLAVSFSRYGLRYVEVSKVLLNLFY